ncbi:MULTISPECIES: glycerol-3-phosphate responsive antiterminator [unclassified Candidatus Frackibacter]|uniref:glycerol-3-phosphate responsive antiterminator n=1 Tax=unclassified Candidatus Frackibacter TaxID=2648818 RepID=UPI000792CA2D|nr:MULTISPECIES: glycerol-3-phosphate responsive antiterminator [unclassified Candidatus Frackibacter]KXS45998.1 MAG: glycerol-3-phosphate responsive antiterminator (mRNA-binding) [Candidatus Frackibacter sp. T328-2]SDC90547.1 glycerol uptake operon antiterminator [Candidatus Frackibacter sp. WG11]SEN04366.1 glycerol uptake operon antiterminator [Candidatus Frackibacter sp. WG12]SFM12097.1 glycerol uptake operon antiterminator [Candidatus Frackibacter sp. WG13]
MSYFEYILVKRPVIAAVKDLSDLHSIPEEKIAAIFVLGGDIFSLPKIVKAAVELDKLVFLHIDLMKGIGKDKYGMKYLAEEVGIDGIVTTKSYLVKEAKKYDLITIQRLFILDSSAFETGVNIIKSSKPDLVEVLPGLILPHVISDLTEALEQPIIAGGLIKNQEQLEDILKTETLAVSTSSKELWEFERKDS